MFLLLVPAIFLSFDSFVAAVALGTFRISRRRIQVLTVLFGMCDGLATLIGASTSDPTVRGVDAIAGWCGPALFCLFGAYLFLAAWLGHNTHVIRRPWFLFMVPCFLSLDNLVTAHWIARGSSHLAAPILFGTVSATFALAGFGLAAVIARHWGFRPGYLSGLACTLAGIAMIVLN